MDKPGFYPDLARVVLLSFNGEFSRDRIVGYSREEVVSTIGTLSNLSEEFDIQPPLLEDAEKISPKTTLSGRILGFLLHGSNPERALKEASIHEFIITGKFENGTTVDEDSLNSVVEQICSIDSDITVPFHSSVDSRKRVHSINYALLDAPEIALEWIVDTESVDMSAVTEYITKAQDLPDEIIDHLDSIRFDAEALEELRTKVLSSKDSAQATRFNLIAESVGIEPISKKQLTKDIAQTSGNRAVPRTSFTKPK